MKKSDVIYLDINFKLIEAMEAVAWKTEQERFEYLEEFFNSHLTEEEKNVYFRYSQSYMSHDIAHGRLDSESRLIESKSENIPDNQDKVYENLLFLAAFFCIPGREEELIEHLEERFEKDSEKFGAAKAKFLLTKRVAYSFLPFITYLIRLKLLWILSKLGFQHYIEKFFQ